MRLPRGYSYITEKQLYKFRFTYDGSRYSVYGRSVKECEEKRKQLEQSLENQMHIDNRTITLKKYFDLWITEQAKEVKDSTVYAYQKSWKYIEPLLGGRQIRKLSKADVQLMQKKMLDSGSSPDNINRVTRLLKQILNSAVNDRIIIFNPCNGIKKLKSYKQKAVDTNHRALTEQETTVFLEYAKDCSYINLFRFLLATGCRIGEATALTWFDISFEKSEINVNKTVSRTANNVFEISTSPKTDSSNRAIPITQEIKNILENQKERNSMLYGSRCAFVFPNSRGNLANYNSVNVCIGNVIKNISDKCEDFEPFTAHAFRDTFATRCIEQGMQPQTLKALLGHSSLKMTMDLYAHVMPNTKQEELERIRFVV